MAEIDSVGTGMNNIGEPALQLWVVLLALYHTDEDNWQFRINVNEDNTACMTVARTGNNPTMKTLERGHGIRVGNIHDRIMSGDFNMIHTRTVVPSRRKFVHRALHYRVCQFSQRDKTL